MIYIKILVSYVKLDHYWNDFLKRKVLIEFLKVSIDVIVRHCNGSSFHRSEMHAHPGLPASYP